MIGGIQVGAGMGCQGKKLHGPAQTAGKLFRLKSRIKILHLFGTHFMIKVIDFRNHYGWIAGQFRLDTDA